MLGIEIFDIEKDIVVNMLIVIFFKLRFVGMSEYKSLVVCFGYFFFWCIFVWVLILVCCFLYRFV